MKKSTNISVISKKAVAALLCVMLLFSLMGCKRDDKGLSPVSPSETAPAPEVSSFDGYTYALPADNRISHLSGLVLIDPDEYASKPCVLQEGTELNYFGAPIAFDVEGSLAGGVFAGNIYEGLVYRYLNDPGDIRGLIAESWTVSDDLRTWTFKIREGVFFTDGTVCDANAVVECWDMTKNICFYANANIESWEALNDRELVINLSAPCPWFLSTLADRMVVSPSALRQYGLSSPEACVGTGPYTVDQYDASKNQLTLKANARYYLPEHYPSIETVNLFPEEHNTMVSKLRNGELKNAGAVFTEADYYLNSVSSIDPDGVTKVYKNESAIWLSPNGFEKLAAKEVRQALCRLVDFGAVNEEIYGGEGLVMDSIWAKGTIGYRQTEDFRHNAEEGLQLLASVGLNIEDIRFTSYCDLTDSDPVLDSAAAQLNDLGADITLTYRHPAASFSDFEKPWAMIGGLTLFNMADPCSFLTYEYALPDFLAEYYGSDAYPFRHFWQDMYDQELYELMRTEYEALRSAPDWEELEAHFGNISAYAQEDYSAIGGVQPPVWLYLDSGLKNEVCYCVGSQQFTLQFYYLYT